MIEDLDLILRVTENFCIFSWTVPLKNETSQTITNSFEFILSKSKRRPCLFGTDDGIEISKKNLLY